jgi:uncharacterized protein (TIGR02145 family)
VKLLCSGNSYEANQRCTSGYQGNDFIESPCGTGWYAPATQFCRGNNGVYKCGTQEYSAAQYCSNDVVQNYGSVVHEGKTYNTVVIGSQTWMAENLNYNVSGSVCYDNISANCDTYGRLYNWATAMYIDLVYNSSSYSGATSNHKGICPEGWHIPTKDEWHTIAPYINPSSPVLVNATPLKSKVGWSDCGPSSSYRYSCPDNYGFAALPGGYVQGSDNSHLYMSTQGRWWSASDGAPSCAYSLLVGNSDNNGQLPNSCGGTKSNLLSVRCLKN